MTNGGGSDACKPRTESIGGTWQLGAKSERRDATHVPNEGIAPELLADPIAGTRRTITLMTPQTKSVSYRTHADAERHPPSLRYSEEVAGGSGRSVQCSANAVIGSFRSVKLSVGSVKLSLRPSNSLYESRIRKSIRKSDVGFCWDLTFVTHPTFVSLAIRCFGNGKRKCFFDFRKRKSDTKVKS